MCLFSFSCHFNIGVVSLPRYFSSIPVNNEMDLEDYLITLNSIVSFQMFEYRMRHQWKIYVRIISSLNIISNRCQTVLSLNMLKCYQLLYSPSTREMFSKNHYI